MPSTDYLHGMAAGFVSLLMILLLVGAAMVFRACRMEAEAAGFDAHRLIQAERTGAAEADQAAADPLSEAEQTLDAQADRRDHYAKLKDGTSQHAVPYGTVRIEQTGPQNLPAPIIPVARHGNSPRHALVRPRQLDQPTEQIPVIRDVLAGL
ncbi:hypothetical protein [Crossiella sp. CA198]|uniref:hypothetical protein n=1 Tax=Crossiella sp. CA198 TaxID=3455607 RepID=UPI003F8D0CFB